MNNAGVLRDNLLFKMSGADWDTVMQVHLRGTFLMTRAAQRHMTAARWGRIVNLSSTSALGNRGQANYAAAKAGLQGFTKTVAHELGKFGVTCNAVAPGLHRHRDDPGHRRAGRADLRGVQRRPRRDIPVNRRRPARGRRRRRVVLLLAALRLRLRPGRCTSPAAPAPDPPSVVRDGMARPGSVLSRFVTDYRRGGRCLFALGVTQERLSAVAARLVSES